MVIVDNQFDIFQWASWADANKKDLIVSPFLFNKNYTPYALYTSEELGQQLKALFLYDIISAVEMGAAIGLSVRDFATTEQADNTLRYSELESIQNANTLVHLIEDTIGAEAFNEYEHELKRMHGIAVQFRKQSHPEQTFYIVKQLQKSQILDRNLSWQIKGDNLCALDIDGTIKMPVDNQVLIASGKVFAFNPKKFVGLFRQDPSRGAAVKLIIKLLIDKFALAFPEGLSIEQLADDNKSLMAALMKLDTEHLPSLGDIVDYADEMNLALTTNDEGGVVIMDSRDAMMFVNMLSDNYVDSGLTGAHYLVKNKQLISGDAQLNMNI